MIVWLYSFPRSGNTFLRILVHHAFDIPTYSVYGDHHQGDALLQEIGTAGLAGQQALPHSLEQCQDSPEVYFIKTHQLPPAFGKVVHLHRDGRDAYVSFAHYYLRYELPRQRRKRWTHWWKRPPRHFDDALESLIVSQQDNWSTHCQKIRELNLPTLNLSFRQLTEHPDSCLHSLAKFMELPEGTAQSTPPKFKELNVLAPHFFRQGRSGNWRREMSSEQCACFWKRHGKTMLEMGYHQ